MAWPHSKLTTYVANSTPVVKAADLNALQDAVIAFVDATWSFKSIYIDGTGGNTVSPAKGRLYVRGGTACVAGDFALANWGAAPSVAVASDSTDARGVIEITAGAGAATTNSVTFTFKDGTYTTVPFIIPSLVYSDDASGTDKVVQVQGGAATATQVVWLIPGLTPVDTKKYYLAWAARG